MTKKEKTIQKINAIINKYGSFSSGEVMADCSPCVSSSGNIVSLAEQFYVDSAEVEVYDTSSMSSDSMSTYTENYSAMHQSTLDDILQLAKTWKEQGGDF